MAGGASGWVLYSIPRRCGLPQAAPARTRSRRLSLSLLSVVSPVVERSDRELESGRTSLGHAIAHDVLCLSPGKLLGPGSLSSGKFELQGTKNEVSSPGG